MFIFIKVVIQATANAFIAIHILMPYNIILYFRLIYFHVSICALFSTYYSSTLILYRRSLDTFYTHTKI